MLSEPLGAGSRGSLTSIPIRRVSFLTRANLVSGIAMMKRRRPWIISERTSTPAHLGSQARQLTTKAHDAAHLSAGDAGDRGLQRRREQAASEALRVAREQDRRHPEPGRCRRARGCRAQARPSSASTSPTSSPWGGLSASRITAADRGVRQVQPAVPAGHRRGRARARCPANPRGNAWDRRSRDHAGMAVQSLSGAGRRSGVCVELERRRLSQCAGRSDGAGRARGRHQLPGRPGRDPRAAAASTRFRS